MGYDIERLTIVTRLSKHNSPQDRADEQTQEDLQAAVGAILADDPRFGDLVVVEDGFVQAYNQMEWERRVRVIQILHDALARVRMVTPEQAKAIPDDKLKRI